jgi:FixJ family two-component response regulator
MVLDVRLPGKSGLAFYDDMVRAGGQRPVIFISGHADVPMSVRAMKAGAVEFLTKPVRDQDLLDAVHLAIERDRAQRAGARLIGKIKQDFESLSQREREVMGYVVAGYQNRQIAAQVGLSEGTVKLHRGNVMHKMQAGSLADLIRIADALGMPSKK